MNFFYIILTMMFCNHLNFNKIKGCKILNFLQPFGGVVID